MMVFTKSNLLWLLAGFSLLASASGRSVLGVKTAGNQRLLYTPDDMLNATVPETSSGSSAFDRVWVYVVGFGSALVLIMTISALAGIYLRCKRRPTAVSPYWRQGMSGQLQRSVFETTVLLLEREEVEQACEDFSNIIGFSPDSVVYKGTLANGTEIAATSMRIAAANWSPQNELSFRRKVEALARMKHSHLVNLVGYCSEEEPFTRILIFEYASNGTLYDRLHNKESEHLDWPTRMRVVMGAAYGLTYMHHELVPPASHLSFGANSIYLTDDYAAKVANFGVTKMSESRNERQKTSWLALRTDDSWGFDRQSPEFENNICSFGVFLLEVITGRPPHDERTGYLVHWANEYLNDPKMVWYMVDPTLKSYNHDELVALCKIATLCLSLKNRRPSMRKVSNMLADVLKLTPDIVGPKSTATLWAQLELHEDIPNV